MWPKTIFRKRSLRKLMDCNDNRAVLRQHAACAEFVSPWISFPERERARTREARERPWTFSSQGAALQAIHFVSTLFSVHSFNRRETYFWHWREEPHLLTARPPASCLKSLWIFFPSWLMPEAQASPCVLAPPSPFGLGSPVRRWRWRSSQPSSLLSLKTRNVDLLVVLPLISQ